MKAVITKICDTEDNYTNRLKDFGKPQKPVFLRRNFGCP